MTKKTTLGISVKKEDDVHAWFTEVINKAELIEYTDVSGCYILRPWAFRMWELLQEYVDTRIKVMGVKNTSFPLFIPEKLLTKEEEHVEGFAPEVAWVTHHGETKLKERLAIRPTSETIMYDTFSKWIRSHRDLPLEINQWCNIVRWEFKNPQPFLRSREFLWQEGHTVYATKKEAEKNVHDALDMYEDAFKELYAVPTLKGVKSEKEKFAGAEYTTSVEIFLPVGKAIQGATSHHLGQKFSKAFDITFIDKNDKKDLAWQNSWGISTRSIGVMILMHGDDKGLVLPPRIAPYQAVIIPILVKGKEERVMKEVHKLATSLKNFRVHIDDREGQSPGFKFSHWELKGVPLRIEVGPKDVEKEHVMIARRDTGKKEAVKMKDLHKEVSHLLGDIQEGLCKNAEKFLKASIKKATTMKDMKIIVKDSIAFVPWCGDKTCEETIKDNTGAKSLNSPFDQKKITEKCFACKKTAEQWTYFAKSL